MEGMGLYSIIFHVWHSPCYVNNVVYTVPLSNETNFQGKQHIFNLNQT